MTESERIGIVIIVGAGDGKRDGLDARQGGLKLPLPGRFLPVIHRRHIKQLKGHAAVCPRRSSSSPFYRPATMLHHVLQDLSFWVSRREPQGILMHAGRLAKNRAPFHPSAAAWFQAFQDHGVHQTRGRVHQGVARQGGLAKEGAPHLIWGNEPSAGALPSNAILRLEKSTNAYHSHTPKMSRARLAALL